MGSFKMSDVASAGQDDLDAGVYDLEVLDFKSGQTKNKKAYGAINWRVASGVDEGNRVRNAYFEQENGISFSILKANLKALGLPSSFLKEDPTDEEVTERIAGLRAEVEVSVRQHKGNTYTTYRVIGVKGQSKEDTASTEDNNGGFVFGDG